MLVAERSRWPPVFVFATSNSSQHSLLPADHATHPASDIKQNFNHLYSYGSNLSIGNHDISSGN
jgi:hypothetical protein